MQTFSGLGRRLEYKGKIANTTFYDDYAVQPYTILKTANAIKEKFSKKRALLVLEPHTYSRVNKYLKEFIRSRKVTFSLDEQVRPEVGRLLRQASKDYKKGRKISPAFSSAEDVLTYLHSQ